MPQHLTLIATVRPSEIVGYAYMRDEDAPEGYRALYEAPSVVESWEHRIGAAAVALLPDDLFVRPIASGDPEEETIWEVYSAAPSDSHRPHFDGTRSDADREADRRMADVMWLQVDQQVVADRIDLDRLTREAIQEARLVADSGV